MRPLRNVLSTVALIVFSSSGGYAASVTGTVKGPDGAAFRGSLPHCAQNCLVAEVNAASGLIAS